MNRPAPSRPAFRADSPRPSLCTKEGCVPSISRRGEPLASRGETPPSPGERPASRGGTLALRGERLACRGRRAHRGLLGRRARLTGRAAGLARPRSRPGRRAGRLWRRDLRLARREPRPPGRETRLPGRSARPGPASPQRLEPLFRTNPQQEVEVVVRLFDNRRLSRGGLALPRGRPPTNTRPALGGRGACPTYSPEPSTSRGAIPRAWTRTRISSPIPSPSRRAMAW
jgi:hypothetical protein